MKDKGKKKDKTKDKTEQMVRLQRAWIRCYQRVGTTCEHELWGTHPEEPWEFAIGILTKLAAACHNEPDLRFDPVECMDHWWDQGTWEPTDEGHHQIAHCYDWSPPGSRWLDNPYIADYGKNCSRCEPYEPGQEKW